MEVGRHSNTLDIRRNYKRLIKIYHPDKNFEGGEEIFKRVKISYDVRNFEVSKEFSCVRYHISFFFWFCFARRY